MHCHRGSNPSRHEDCSPPKGGAQNSPFVWVPPCAGAQRGQGRIRFWVGQLVYCHRNSVIRVTVIPSIDISHQYAR